MSKGALLIAIKAARAGGQVLLRNLNRLESIPVVEKERNDFASEVDRNAEKEIMREIKRAFPKHAFLAEESGAAGQGRHVWVIDPLDGTSNYLRSVPHFSVSIALVEDGEVILGVVFDPLRSELFTALKGGGAFLNDKRMRVSQRKSLDGALVVTGFPFRQHQHLDAHWGMTRAVMLAAHDIRRSGSAALDLAYVACGRFDAYFEAGVKPWDVAAGSLLMREAGGRCTDFAGGEKFITTGNIVAANIKVGDALLAAIAPHRGDALRA